MIQVQYSDPAPRVNSDKIQATRITRILSGHKQKSANLLGGPDQNIAYYWRGPVSHLKNIMEDQIRTQPVIIVTTIVIVKVKIWLLSHKPNSWGYSKEFGFFRICFR